MNFTDKAIERLKSEKMRDIRDDKVIGLYLRVRPTGRKIWRYRYRLRGQTQVISIGDYAKNDAGGVSLKSARSIALAYREQVVKGEDPGADIQRAESERDQMPTVSEFIPEYIKRHAKPKKQSWKQDEQILTKWVEPRIGRMKMDQVTRRDIVSILDKVRDSGATRQPGKVLAVTRMMFKVAIQRGILESTPCMYIEESQPEPPRRAMSAEQVRLWWTLTGDAIESDAPAIPKASALALRLLLLTGQRPGEIANATRDELHLKSDFGPYWLIPGERRKKGRARKGKDHAVALESLAVETIRQAMALSESEYIFEKANGGPVQIDSLEDSLDRIFGKPPRPTKPKARKRLSEELPEIGSDKFDEIRVVLERDGLKLTSARTILKQALSVAEIDESRALRIVDAVYPATPTPHWARHTVATELAELGFDEYYIGRVLGHVSKSVTGTVYINQRINESALRNQRKLLAAWEARLQEILGAERPSNVVALEA